MNFTSPDLKKEQRGFIATQTTEEKNACCIDDMLNGGTCEACQ